MTSTLSATPETMKAVVKTGPGHDGVQLVEVPVRAIEPGLVRVRVIATGICGTDVHIAADEYGHEAPVVMGHEVVGEVIEADGAEAVWLGRIVACETYFSACEQCDYCRTGRRNLCGTRRSLGSYEDGGFAASVVMPVANLHEVPDSAGALGGVLSEPLACVAHCLMSPPVVNPGDRVLVTGPGAMGQLAAQIAVAQGGVVTLAGLDRDADRLAIAAAFGIGTTTEAPAANSFDVVIECSGSAPAAAACFGAAVKGGRYVQVGIFGCDVSVPLDAVLYKELTITSGFASTPQSWRDAMRLIEQQRVVLDPLVTSRVPLTEFRRAFEAAQRGEGIKTVVVP